MMGAAGEGGGRSEPPWLAAAVVVAVAGGLGFLRGFREEGGGLGRQMTRVPTMLAVPKLVDWVTGGVGRSHGRTKGGKGGSW